MAARPGRVPRAPQDDPQRARPAAPASTRPRVDAALAAAGIDPDRRPQTLAVGEWLALTRRSAGCPTARPACEAYRRRRERPAGDSSAPGRPPRPGEAQPDARRARAAAGDGFHDLHSVLVPARPRRPAEPRVRPRRARRTRSTSTGLDAGPPADNLVLRARGRGPRRRSVAAGRADPGPPPALAAPPREADPGRGRARRRLVGRGRGARRRARGLGRGARRPSGRHDGCRRASARTCRSSSPAAPALVEGRGERVVPLTRAPSATPGRAARHAGRRRPDARRSSPPSMPIAAATATASVRMSLRTPRRGARRRALGTRTSSPGRASSRRPTTSCRRPRSSLPGLVPFRRALSRVLGRPIGLSGSGPTLWALYPSEDEAAGPRRRPSARPSPTGHSRAGRPSRSCAPRPSSPPAIHGGDTPMTRRAVTTAGAPAALGPYSQAIVVAGCRVLLGPDRARSRDRRARRGRLEAQAERALRNLGAVLDAAGVTFVGRGQDHDLPRPTSTTSRRSTRSTRGSCPIRRRPARRSRSRRLPKGAGRGRGHRTAIDRRRPSVDTPAEAPIRCRPPMTAPSRASAGTRRGGASDRPASPARRRPP